ncbi:AmmeMemoRadiSam system protein B [Luteococcus sediminum]
MGGAAGGRRPCPSRPRCAAHRAARPPAPCQGRCPSIEAGIITTRQDGIATPLGVVRTWPGTDLDGMDAVRCDDQLHAVEPSLEGQLAFLQNRFAVFQVLPLLTVGQVTGPLTEVLDLLWRDSATAVIVTSDLGQALPVGELRRRDAEALQAVVEGRELDAAQACHHVSINAAVQLARRHGLSAELLGHDSSRIGRTRVAGSRDGRVHGSGTLVWS